ncbi:MAG: hypothetical protein GYB53_23870 [Rhodobacteraceae bacterium]|nr:hypothetical protein [Paracoccaceae bacterium]MBR9823698.1 hypothetical protein [Paracoccaceae bacterium]
MPKSAEEMSDVLALSFVSFMALAKHSLTPAQTKIATERAGNCLWALGVEEYAGFHALAPEALGETIEGTSARLITSSGHQEAS